MSGRLGTIPYPSIDPSGDEQTNPLAKYTKQLDPLAKLTDQLWQTPRAPGLAPIQPPMTALSLAQLAHARQQQGIMPAPTPGVMTPPAAGLSPPSGAAGLAAAAPGPSAAAMSAPMPAAAPPGAPPGGPGDVTQFQQDPTSGGLVRQRGALARRLAAQTMGGPTFASEALAQAGGAPGAAPEAPTSPEQEQVQSRDQDRISTRIPSEPEQKKTGINAHETSGLTIGLDSLKRAPEALAKNAQLIKNYPGFEHLRTDDPTKINEAFINHAKDNLKWLYGKMNDEKGPIGPGIVERAKQWYNGANRIAHSLAREYNVQPYQAAAVLAALSPQKDWYQNVHLARKVFEAHQLGHNWRMTDEMQRYSDKYIKSLEKTGEDDPKKIGELRALQQKFQTTPMSRLTDPHERAVFARWHDEAHNPRDYKMVTPEGGFGETSMIPAKYTKKGVLKEAARPRSVSWGSFNEIAKATAALQNASLPEVSRLMGGNHKVRNFFNNIIAPHALHGDVTIDTHAIAAALLRPLGGGSMPVGHGLGTSTGKGVPGAANSATVGNRGMYGLYAEAYRRAAKDLGILPRELQSVTWEGVRGLFSPEQKRNPGFVQHVENIWRNRGEFRGKTPDERREAIASHAGGLKPPSWAGGTDYGDDAED
jgi:hypothetical protein